MPGAMATDLSGTDLEDKPETLNDLLKKKKLTALVFWDSDCGHCRRAHQEWWVSRRGLPDFGHGE